MVRKLIERACGAWDDRMLAAAATTMLLLVGGIASLVLLSLTAFCGCRESDGGSITPTPS